MAATSIAPSAAIGSIDVRAFGRRHRTLITVVGSLVTALEDFMTPAEQELVERGDARFVRQLHSVFGEAIADEYVRAAEGGLGREVLAHRSEVICASGICLDIFSLANEPLPDG